VALPLWPTWFLFSAIGAWIGQSFGKSCSPRRLRLAAMFITIIAVSGRTADRRCDCASALAALFAKLYVPGQWFILLGDLAGVIVAALLHSEEEENGSADAIESGTP